MKNLYRVEFDTKESIYIVADDLTSAAADSAATDATEIILIQEDVTVV